MSPEIILMILQYGLKYGPSAAKAVKDLFTREDPSQADWDAVWNTMSEPWKDPVIPPPPALPVVP